MVTGVIFIVGGFNSDKCWLSEYTIGFYFLHSIPFDIPF